LMPAIRAGNVLVTFLLSMLISYKREKPTC
jgi:hypothetical protein